MLKKSKTNNIPKKIWIDFDNSPHVPFFRPIIDELRSHGYNIVLTGRKAYQVSELINKYKLNAKLVGSHYGKNKLLKVINVFYRALQLMPMVIKENPDYVNMLIEFRGHLFGDKEPEKDCGLLIMSKGSLDEDLD